MEEIDEALLRKVMEAFGIKKLNPVQKESFPKIASGVNTLIVAPTGSGKTEAAMIPVLYKAIKEKLTDLKPFCLYITPLRALNRDMLRRFVSACSTLGFDVAVRHGDTPPSERRRQSENPPHILITTPETFNVLFFGKKLREFLKNIKFVVIDEVHELVESKRGVQLTLLLERLREYTKFQRILLSATVENPRKVAEFFMGGEECCVIRVGLEKEYIVKVDSSLAFVERQDILHECAKKIIEICERIPGNVLVFTNTRETAELLSYYLKEIGGDRFEVHHGSLARESREKAEREFREGKIKCLVATSSMELGIDIGRIALVVQVGSPRQVKRLIQRVGRAGHRIETPSIGVVLPLSPQDLCESIAIRNMMHFGWMERERMYKMSLDVLAHQIVGMCIERKEIKVSDILRVFSRAYPYRGLTKDIVVALLRFLDRIGVIRFYEDTERVKLTRKSIEYYVSNISTIPDEKSFSVISIEDKKRVGILHERFVVESVDEGECLLLRGTVWLVEGIDYDKGIILAKRYTANIVKVPAWEGELIPVEREVAEESYRYIREYSLDLFSDAPKDVPRIEVEGDLKVLVFPYGNRINNTISFLIYALSRKKCGITPEIKSDQYRIYIHSKFLTASDIKYILEEIKSKGVKGTLNDCFEYLKEYRPFLWRFHHVLQRMGVIRKGSTFSWRKISDLADVYFMKPPFIEAINELLVEKFDLEGAEDVIRSIDPASIPVYTGLSSWTASSLMVSAGGGGKSVSEIIRERLENTKLVAVCPNCGVLFHTRLKDVDRFVCPKCAARIAYLPENKAGDKRWIAAAQDLLITFGKIALYPLAANLPLKDVSELLRKYSNDLERLLREIARRETLYALKKKR